MRPATIASATHSCTRANHHPGGGNGTNGGLRTKATSVAPHREVDCRPTTGRHSPAPPRLPPPPSERTGGLLHLCHRGCLCNGARCCAAPALGLVLSVPVAAHAARGPWTTPESPLLRRSGLAAAARGSSTRTQNPCSLPSLLTIIACPANCPVAGPALCAADLLRHARYRGLLSQSVVRIGHSYSCTTNGKGHLYRGKVANLGISGSHSGTHCVFRTRGKSYRLKAT